MLILSDTDSYSNCFNINAIRAATFVCMTVEQLNNSQETLTKLNQYKYKYISSKDILHKNSSKVDFFLMHRNDSVNQMLYYTNRTYVVHAKSQKNPNRQGMKRLFV